MIEPKESYASFHRRVRRTGSLSALLPNAAPAADPFEINAILPLTGQAAFIGKASAEGLKAAEALANKAGGIAGRPVTFVVQDDQSNPANDVQLANALIAKKVPIIMGSALVANCNAMVPLVKDGPVLYCLSPALHPDPGSYVFSGGVAASDTIFVAIRYARMRGWTRIATINPTDATGQDADKSIAAALAEPENRDLQIVDREHFNLTDVSVAAQVAHVESTNPQLVIAWASGTAIATVFRAINDAAYKPDPRGRPSHPGRRAGPFGRGHLCHGDRQGSLAGIHDSRVRAAWDRDAARPPARSG